MPPASRRKNHLTGDLLVIVPSRGRPQNVARMLDAVHATAKMTTHVHVAVDDDDPELERYEYVMKQAAGDGDRLTTGPRKGLAAWTNEIAVPRAAEYPFLASFGDDHVPYTPGWDRALIRAIVDMGGTGFSYPWDGTREDIPEAVVMSSRHRDRSRVDVPARNARTGTSITSGRTWAGARAACGTCAPSRSSTPGKATRRPGIPARSSPPTGRRTGRGAGQTAWGRTPARLSPSGKPAYRSQPRPARGRRRDRTARHPPARRAHRVTAAA
jgi:hypothetical protein